MPDRSTKPVVFIGTYTEHEGSQSKGIYVYRLETASGALVLEREVPGVLNPSYLALHPHAPFLYAVNEVQSFAGRAGGGVSAFGLDAASGEVHPLNTFSSGGMDPCYISIEHTGRFALVANYTGGNAAMFPIQADGRLGAATDLVQHSGSSVHPERQTAPFVHCIVPDPANRFALAADLGSDRLVIYAMDLENGKLNRHAEVRVMPGSGPRHLLFHPHGTFLYLINELNSTLVVYRYDGDAGRVREVQTVSTLPPGFHGENLCADLHIQGGYLYASNRKHDSIAWYRIDEDTGQLTYQDEVPSGGREPRGFAIDPGGNFLLAAHQRSDNVVTFRIDQDTGRLSRTGHAATVSYPVCVKFGPWQGSFYG